MRPIIFPVLALLTVLCAGACKDEPFNPAAGHINFSDMQVGQKSRYLILSGENYYIDSDTAFTYSDDTLTLEIVGKTDYGFICKENIQHNGAVDPWLSSYLDTTFYYTLINHNDTLLVRDTNPALSSLPYTNMFVSIMYSSTGLPLADINDNPVEIKGWKTSLPYCECDRKGYTVNYTQFGEYFLKLNVVVNNSDMAVDGPGYTYVYNKYAGIVRYATYSWWTQSGYGLDLLPEE